MVVRYHHRVYDRYVVDLTGHLGEAFRAHEGERTAAVLEDGVKENANSAWKFDQVAGVAEPGCAKLGGSSRG